MSPYRIAPATAAPTPKRSAVVRLWRMGKRDLFRQPHPALSALALWPLWALVFGYLRLRRVRAALAPCPTHRAMGKHGRCGHYACCYACFRKDYDDVMALGERSAELQRETVARLTRYQATTETRERARYASGATAAVAEARDRRKRIR